ncbi:hypothetical protein NMG60_11035459 [Bertholletia excelsa]
MAKGENSHKGLKICCAVTLILLIIFIIVAVILSFTVFKPKMPEVTAHPANLENISFQLSPTFSFNATLGLVISINNRNYGSFKYKNTTAYIDYRGTTVAEVPIEAEKVPARGKLNITTYANVTADKLVTNPNFLKDLAALRFNFTSTTAMDGKVSLMNVFKMGATIYTSCDISVTVQSDPDVESVCSSMIKL